MRSDENRDYVSDANRASIDSRSSLTRALTERHGLHLSNATEDLFSLDPTGDLPYVSERERGINGAQVAEYLRWPHVAWGVDFLALSFSVRSINPEPPEPWDTQVSSGGRWTHKWKASLAVGEGWVDLVVTRRFTGLTAYVQFNPTTCLYGPKTASIARLDDALYITGKVLDAVSHWVTPACPPEEMCLSRVDASMDVVHVSDVQRLLRLVQGTPVAGKAARVEYTAGGRLQSVTKRTKTTGGYCIYDKGLQAGLDHDVVRFEVTSRRRRLVRICPRLGDLTDVALRQMAVDVLNPVLDHLALTPTSALDDILADPTDTKTLTEMVGIGLLQCLGHYPNVTKYMLTKKYRPLLRKYQARTVGDLIRSN